VTVRARLAGFYQRLALIVFNLLLLFLILNGFVLLFDLLKPSAPTMGPYAAPPPLDDPATNRAVVGRWIANTREIEALAARYHTRVLFVRQPVPTYAYDTAYHLFTDDLEPYARPRLGYAGWEQMMNQRTATLDLAMLGNKHKVQLYVDAVHYTPEFMDESAAAIVRALITRHLVEE
jgi:hypothetical protein